MRLYNEDCIEGMRRLEDNSVDLICTDPPYGTTLIKWDTPLPLDDMWREFERVLKPYGTVILFGQQPFSSTVVSSKLDMFKYSLVWKKSKVGHFAQAPYRPLTEHEDVLVFSRGGTAKNSKNPMKYNPQGLVPCHIARQTKHVSLHCPSGHPTAPYTQTHTNYPRSILDFPTTYGGKKVLHPTQKPVELIEYLVRTFSDSGDVVLDACMGSGTTGVACVRAEREFVGFELDSEYFQCAKNRIETSQRHVNADPEH